MYLIEACTASVLSTIEAARGGAGRVELCDNLYEGGTTPSAATIEIACDAVKIPIYAMIRPRGGDFLYSDLEFKIMQRDIQLVKHFGASGIALGLLCADGSIDQFRTRLLVDQAKGLGLGVTFHRAFDMAADPVKALEAVIATGCERILTSGGENKAMEGKDRIASMVRQAAGRISIMAGSGVNPTNAKKLLTYTGIREIHMSGKRKVPGSMIFRNDKIRMGGLEGIPEYEIEVTDADAVRQVYNAINS